MNRPATKKAGFTLVEIMIVVLIIGILLAIAIPNFVQAREASRAKACVGNLKQIDSAKQQCAMDLKLASTSTDTFNITGAAATGTDHQIVGQTSYIRTIPTCSAGGVYTPGTILANPSCSISGFTGSPSTTGVGDYAPPTTAGAGAGRFYHGL